MNSSTHNSSHNDPSSAVPTVDPIADLLTKATSALAVSILCLVFCVVILLVACIKYKKLLAQQEAEIQELRRVTNDQEYYVDHVSRKLTMDMDRVNETLGKLVKPDEFIELKAKTEHQEELLSDVRSRVSEEMNADIFLLSMKMKTVEDRLMSLEKNIEVFLSQASPKSTKKPQESPAAKGLQSHQNNRIFDEILKYRGKIVQLEKREDERSKKLLVMDDKLNALLGILNIQLEEKNTEQTTNIDTGISMSYRYIQVRSPAIFQQLRASSRNESSDRYMQETGIDLLTSPTVMFQLPPTFYSESSIQSEQNSNDSSSDRLLGNESQA